MIAKRNRSWPCSLMSFALDGRGCPIHVDPSHVGHVCAGSPLATRDGPLIDLSSEVESSSELPCWGWKYLCLTPGVVVPSRAV
ncbi:hypothetical protein CEXT_187441 [Caerostris extrusa]|uniref:Uncharacterized protein n=1 Tax=Caerostris extrusa TaxID=172846 RepID=A0AAV4WWN8_CAEEX|nr:hypothetical protein CEXT_187441 [Caerostris extrusa]